MEVNIAEITSSVRAVDSDTLVAPQTMEKIVRAVLRVVEERENHQQRVRAEQRITGGVHEEQEEREP